MKPFNGIENKILTGHSNSIDSLCFLPNNKLVSGSGDKTIKIWALINYNKIKTFKGHKGCVSCLCVLPNNKLASCNSDKTIKIWN